MKRVVAMGILGLSLAACAKPSSRLSISVDGEGDTDPAPGAHMYPSGSTVKVMALPATGAEFQDWSGAASGTANPVAVVVDGELSLVARFHTPGGSSNGASASSSGATSSSSSSGSGRSSSSGGASSSSGSSSSGGGASSSSGGSSSSGSSASSSGSGSSSSSGGMSMAAPCDIYAAAGTPCVAAHSTVRALYGAYSGRLYQVRRSDGTKKDIATVAAGGAADGAAQDAFCSGTSCVITLVYDQSGKDNHLEYQGSGSSVGGQDDPAVATTESLTLGGHKVYALYIKPGNSYWRNGSQSGIPTGSAPEGVYMVTSGTHVNSGCCFDYGNSETTRKADGAGAMDAIYFGTSCWFGGCSGAGPWVQADLEYGLFPGGSSAWNPQQKPFSSKYVTAMLKNNGKTRMALKGANAQSGGLTTLYDGTLPPGYNPMKKQGAIILGSGGDCCATNRNQSEGTFYEGAIVSGYPSDETDASIQSNVAAAGYGR